LAPGHPLRVAFLLDALRDDGASKMLASLASGLSNRGVRVDLMLRRLDTPYLPALAPTVKPVMLRSMHPLWCLPALVRYLRGARPTAMLLSDKIRTNVAALRSRRIARVHTRLVLRVSIALSQELAALAPPVRAHRAARWRRLLPRLDRVVAVSRGVAADVAGLGGMPVKQIAVAPNPVITPEIDALSRAPAPHPWLARGDAPVIMGVGRLHPQKDFASLIRAFAAVHHARPCRLIILGEGEERARLEALANRLDVGPAVSLPGFVTNPYAYLARASVFVLSSAWEGSPNALAEALAVGTPVVATDCPSGPRELLAEGRYGPLVPVGDVDRLALAIAEVLDAPIDPGVLRGAVCHLTLEGSVDKYLHLLGLA
jgi:glycosyltransferase involved in cell wall biosynthesis